MTKQFSMTLIAVVLFALMAVMVVSAESDLPENRIIESKDLGPIYAVTGGEAYLGEEILFFGTNTDTDLMYLFITGPNMAEQGSRIHNRDPGKWAVENDNPTTFKQLGVSSNHTWSWTWDTANYALDPGTYTVYAVGKPLDKNHLARERYGTTTITIKEPLVSATASPIITSATATTNIPTTTAVPIASPTPAESPGYGALIALIGVGAVAFIVFRRC
ncbi:MAG: hypothetical protein M0Q92_11740 [Methanoregula sp.]|jgi:hypothetical protein|nr:hypothetical protein [Methanoregula sp.]